MALKFRGQVWVFGDNLDVDKEIVPFRKWDSGLIKMNELGKWCMTYVDPDFPKKVNPGDIMVVGSNMGCGTAGAGGGGGAAAGVAGSSAESEWDANLPVACVDWCDAQTFCVWSGKRLCNEPLAAPNDAAQSEWYAACSSDATNHYPYGEDYEWNFCLGGEYAANSCPANCPPLPVESFDTCQTDAGVYDLSGNVAEWVSACSVPIGATDDCHYRGGSYLSSSPVLACEYLPTTTRDTTAPYLGFRCCSDPR